MPGKKYYFIWSCILFVVILSCRKNRDKPSWDTDLLLPLMKSSLSIENIIRDTSVVRNPDNSLTLINRIELSNLTLDSLVTLNTPPYNRNVKLSTLVLDTRRDTTRITLGRIARELINTSNPSNQAIGQFILDNHGGTFPFLPAISLNNLGPFDIDVRQFFQSATILTGTLGIEVKNGLPIRINSIDFEIRNKSNNNLIVDHVFNNINPNTSQSMTEDLAGKQVEGILKALLNTLSLNSGFNVPIDTTRAIEVILTISGVTVSEATAIFPAQDVVNNADEVSLVGMKDVELTFAKIAEGKVKIDVVSTAEDNIYFNYKIPSASKNGMPFETNTIVPPAPPGGVSNVSFEYDFSGYDLDLTGQHHNTVNTFFNTLRGRIEYTGNVVHLSLDDSLVIKIYTVGLKPSYVRGYLGRDTIHVGPSSKTLKLFDRIQSGILNFESTQVTLKVNNAMGLSGIFKINQIRSENTKTGEQRILSGGIIGNDNPIQKATDMPFTPATTTLNLSGSNAVELLNILPTKFHYNAMVVTNPAGNDHTYTDFAYSNSSLKAHLDIELPLSILANRLVLCDTADFSAPASERQSVKGGILNLHVENGFPIDVSVRLYFLDAGGVVMDSLITSDVARAAPLGPDGRTTTKEKTTLSYIVSEQRVQSLYRFSKIIIKAKFNSQPSNQHVKIYSDYSIDFKLVGDFSYNVKVK
ncbi:MAG: hypothetical protein NZ529_03950 [Cytophagaceae bacterium]|nr:hypothetical protein [Cytophagaceae bacterium]MDW8455925.1 hypothetical protein [Cytophagaceae bacterium]